MSVMDTIMYFLGVISHTQPTESSAGPLPVLKVLATLCCRYSPSYLPFFSTSSKVLNSISSFMAHFHQTNLVLKLALLTVYSQFQTSSFSKVQTGSDYLVKGYLQQVSLKKLLSWRPHSPMHSSLVSGKQKTSWESAVSLLYLKGNSRRSQVYRFHCRMQSRSLSTQTISRSLGMTQGNRLESWKTCSLRTLPQASIWATHSYRRVLMATTTQVLLNMGAKPRIFWQGSLNLNFFSSWSTNSSLDWTSCWGCMFKKYINSGYIVHQNIPAQRRQIATTKFPLSSQARPYKFFPSPLNKKKQNKRIKATWLSTGKAGTQPLIGFRLGKDAHNAFLWEAKNGNQGQWVNLLQMPFTIQLFWRLQDGFLFLMGLVYIRLVFGNTIYMWVLNRVRGLSSVMYRAAMRRRGSTATFSTEKYPYIFKGLDPEAYPIGNQPSPQFLQSVNPNLRSQLTTSYLNLLQALSQQQRNPQNAQKILDKSLLRSYQPRSLALVNEDAGIEWGYWGSKIIVGLGAERDLWEGRMMRVGYFGDSCLGVYLGANKLFNPTTLPCILQTQILYKSCLKLLTPSTPISPDQQQPQTHLITYELQGTFNPLQTNLQTELKQMKSQMSWFSMAGNRKLMLDFFVKVLGLNSDGNLGFRVVDIDGFMDGNCPVAFPSLRPEDQTEKIE